MHNDLVMVTYNTGWNPGHAQNIIRPDFYQGRSATIKWRYKIVVSGLSMTITTSWQTDTVPGGGFPP
ncbi:MAG: hypothetical protein ACXABZ_08595 [Candidatus Thorarchaeota archaeon]